MQIRCSYFSPPQGSVVGVAASGFDRSPGIDDTLDRVVRCGERCNGCFNAVMFALKVRDGVGADRGELARALGQAWQYCADRGRVQPGVEELAASAVRFSRSSAWH